MNYFPRLVMQTALYALAGGQPARTPLQQQEDLQCAVLLGRLLPILRNRHFGDKQVWYELHWMHLHALGLANPSQYPWPDLSTTVRHRLKDQLLSSGYGVSLPPEPHQHEGVLVTWKATMYVHS